MMEHRRSWTLSLDGREHRVDVVYRALFGLISIEVDGKRAARGWRELQTVFGGATLWCDLNGHRLAARVTPPWARQEYSFALRLDGELQPGSDPQPESKALTRQTLVELVGFGVIIGVIVAIAQVLLSR